MNILIVSHEVAPLAKVGGLADVVGALPKALKKLGHDVRIVMPGYKMVLADPRWQVHNFVSFEVPINPVWGLDAKSHWTELAQIPIYMLKVGDWFDETTSSETIYLPGEDQHIAFAKAVLAFVKQVGWIPDVIHTHDWHTGLVPVFMRESHAEDWQSVGSVHTIHNLAYQGVFAPGTITKAGLDWELFDHHRLETYGQFNFLKSACVYADRVNTVSPTYAQEIQAPGFGCDLEGVMKFLAAQGRLTGILNGIDQDEFNPSKDVRIAQKYGANDLEGKKACKSDLLERLGWQTDPAIPLAGAVSRISSQKGFDLLLAASNALADIPLRIVVQGLGEPWIADRLEALQNERPDRFRFAKRFDIDLAQRIYAGADMFLMPSAFEPCGLGQLIAMRYGTVPVVRKTGGLADTVVDGVTGFVFEEKTPEALVETCRKACELYRDAEAWQKLVVSGMEQDFGWKESAKRYVELYETAISDRRAVKKK